MCVYNYTPTVHDVQMSQPFCPCSIKPSEPWIIISSICLNTLGCHYCVLALIQSASFSI